MAIFAATIKGRSENRRVRRAGQATGRGRALIGALAVVPALALAGPATAQTVGNQGAVSGSRVLFEFFGYGGLVQPNNTDATNPTLVPIQDAVFGFIKNPYLGVVVGIGGTYGVSWPAGTSSVTATHNVAGMLTFGNVDGSSRFSTDNLQALNGFNYFAGAYEIYDTASGRPFGYGVWPLPGWWEITSGGFITYEYSAYTRIQLDDTVTNVMGSNGVITEPQMINSVLRTPYDVGSNVQVEQQIRLYRATAQLRWRITNNDTAPHTVRLRFTVNVRPGVLAGSTDTSRTGYYFLDGNGLVSDNARILTAAGIPDQLTVYGKRYEVDSTIDPPFAARHTLRGFGATIPERVVLAHPFELRPNVGGFYLNSFNRPKLSDGVATAVYFGPYTLAPGATQEVVTYYGNGSPTEIPNNDFVISADGPEALAYNANAVNDPTIAGNVAKDPNQAIPKFLSPSPFTLYGSIYNWTPRDPLNAVGITNVRASLTLPTGLVLVSGETAEKLVNGNGNLAADTGADIGWAVVPTGDAFGTLAYQINMATNEFGSRQITRSINVPATPFRRVTENTFQMIGFPFEFDTTTSNNADPSTVVNGLTSPADDPVVFYQYVPDPQNANGLGRYVVANRLQTGIGYFYKPNLTRTIYARGVKPLAGQANTGVTDFSNANQRQLNLARGWNIISNPYLYDIPLRSLRFVTNINSNPVSQNFTEAVRNGVIRGGVFYLSTVTGSYDFFEDTALPLKPWEGYWIFTTQPITLIYSLPTQRQSAILPAPGADPNPPTRGVIASGRAMVARPTDENWRLQIVARKGNEQNDRATILGVNTDRSVTDAERTVPKPPAGVSDYVYVGVVRPETSTTRFAKDIRATGRTNEWELEVSADQDGPVTLTWPNIGTLPRRLTLSLKDKETGRAYAMRSSSSVTINVRKGQPTRVVVTAKQASAQPLTITNVQIVGGRGQAGGSRSFAFSLSRAATVTGKVKTITGKTVATLAVSRAASSGTNRLQWNGRAENGSMIPPGPYKIEIVAQDDSGETASRTQPFMTIE
ncbi:MAG: FlgD immunoglobulin-like domain containing protein [Capsulimonadales bacterium]|nr:FlgD immunoglobulin-like domain containing protein [Capsulimonadales bacterium]